MLKSTHLAIILALCGGVFTSVAAAQSDDGFDALRSTYRNLMTSAQAVQDPDETVGPIRAMLERVEAYRADHPGHAPSAAMAVQLLLWLDQVASVEPARLDNAYADLAASVEDDRPVRLQWARKLMQSSRYEPALAVLDGADFDPTETPDWATARSQALFALERFAESVSALTPLTQEVLADASPLVSAEVRRVLPQRQEYARDWVREQDLRDQEAEADDLPRVQFTTDAGLFVVELYEDSAPNTVKNFISLVESGFYNGMTWQVAGNAFSRTGDPRTRMGSEGGEANPGYRIADEFTLSTARKHYAGVLSMAVTPGQTHSGGSRFAITHKPAPTRNGRNTVFGRVIEGMDVVRSMPTDTRTIAAQVLRKRPDTEYDPVTLPLVDASGNSANPTAPGNLVELGPEPGGTSDDG